MKAPLNEMKKSIKVFAVCFSFLWLTILVCDAKNTQNHKNLLPFKSQNGKWGYIDDQGKTVIVPRFDFASNFSEGRAAVGSKRDWKCGFIDNTGKIVIPISFSCDLFSDGKAGPNFSDGLALVHDPKTEYIDTQGRKIISYRGVDFDGEFSENLAKIMSSEGKWSKERNKWISTIKHGYIDRTGRIVIAPRFDFGGNFSEGLARVCVNCKFYADEKEQWGYINEHGDMVIKPKFASAWDFSEGLAAVKLGDKWGYIDKTGNLTIKPQFGEPSWLNTSFSEGLAGVSTISQFHWAGTYEGESGNITITKKGYIDKSGAFVIQPIFLDVRPFYHGVAAVYWGGQHWSLINKTGKILANIKADNIFAFKNGAAEVQLGLDVDSKDCGKHLLLEFGYISENGKWILKPSKAWSVPQGCGY